MDNSKQTSSYSSEDFLNKTREGVPFEGPAPSDLSEDELDRVNVRWEQFFTDHYGLLLHFARRDKDLASIGLLSARRTIYLQPDCPESWIIRRAYFDILSAVRWGGSVDCPRSDSYFTRKQVDIDAVPGQYPEPSLYDQLQFEVYWDDLSDMEKKLVEILKHEKSDGIYRWYEGDYVPVHSKHGQARKRFLDEVSSSLKDYMTCYVNARYKFYKHFGSDAEAAREKEWLANWEPYKSLHASRDGRYKGNGAYNRYKQE